MGDEFEIDDLTAAEGEPTVSEVADCPDCSPFDLCDEHAYEGHEQEQEEYESLRDELQELDE